MSINFLWRWLATALCFALFGIGGILLTIVAFPLLFCLPSAKLVRERRARLLIHRSFKLYIDIMKWLGVLDYQIEGREKLQGASLVLANHPSLIDVIFIIAMLPNACCIVKGRLVRNIFTRGPIKAAGYIINDSDSDLIAQASDAFNEGASLVVFPEGTRTMPNQAVRLKRGAANIAVRSQVDVTPVILRCSPTTLTKSDRWYQVPRNKVFFQLIVNDVIKTAAIDEQLAPSKRARILTSELSDYFNRELGKYE